MQSSSLREERREEKREEKRREKRERSGRHGFCVWTEVSAYVPARGASNGTFRRSGSRNVHVLVCSGRVMELNEK